MRPPVAIGISGLALTAAIVMAGCTAGDQAAPATSNAPVEVRERWASERAPAPEPTTPSPRESAPAIAPDRPRMAERPDLPNLTETRPITYVVEPGDTATAIARAHGITLDELLALNPAITNPDLLSIGQRLDVTKRRPGSPSRPTSSPSSRPALTVLDRQCIQLANAIPDTVGITEAEVRQRYAWWKEERLPLCREFKRATLDACREMEAVGLDPFSYDDRELLATLLDLTWDETNSIARGIFVWCR